MRRMLMTSHAANVLRQRPLFVGASSRCWSSQRMMLHSSSDAFSLSKVTSHHSPVSVAASAPSIRYMTSTTSSSSSTPSTTNLSSSPPPFDKVLIANRGEISERISRTVQEMGMTSVAMYATADAKARFVERADEAVWLPTSDTNPQAYLSLPVLTQVMTELTKDGSKVAVHPGYGFLSESTDFCQAVEDMGCVWLGPPAHAITELGDKIRSKQVAQEAGVSTIPGYDGVLTSLEKTLEIVHDTIGYPVLLKAAAGGGGKGMRICRDDAELKDAYALTQAEALQFFGDDRLLVEKYIQSPHHIEFQVMCSGKDDVVVFHERECSIQRRNQKIIEESPSCLLTDDTRAAMVEQTKRLCQRVGYQSAGTLEWLVDEEQNFYFLEMNTRLQVEHPVTEAVSVYDAPPSTDASKGETRQQQSVDLVKAMMWVGAGWGLPPELQISSTLFPAKGHAMEARIYAEDPVRGYLPSTGPLVQYREPEDTFLQQHLSNKKKKKGSSYVRMDSGVQEGHVVSPHYDPMLSKVIAYAPTRDESIATLSRALDEYVIQGVQHNAKLCNAVLQHEVFRSGQTPTSFLEQHIPSFTGVELSAKELEELAVAAAIIGNQRDQEQQEIGNGSSPMSPVVVRLGGMFGEDAYHVMVEDNHDPLEDAGALWRVQVRKVTYETFSSKNDGQPENQEKDPTKTVVLNSLEYDPKDYLARVQLNGTPRSIQVLRDTNTATTGSFQVQMHGADMTCLLQSPREFELSQYMLPPQVVDTSEMVLSPMPGTLISFSVHEGDRVEEGQELCIVEAMKMQNIVRSTRTGVVGTLAVNVGDALRTDQVLIEFETEEEEEDDEAAEQ